jgi:type IX secretion system PorP/SprF family membrane protein
MRKRYWVINIIVGTFTSVTIAQDAHFSQFDKAPMALNPGLAGLHYRTQVAATYRSQWTSINAPFSTIAASFDQRLTGKKQKNSFFGLGVSGISDNIGSRLVSSLDLKLAGSGHVKLNKRSTLGLGIQFGMIQKTVNSGGLQWGSQYDGNSFNSALLNAEGATYNDVKSFDIATGLVYSFNQSDFLKIIGSDVTQFTTGLSVAHLNRPRNSFNGSDERLPMKFSAFGNALISLPRSSLSVGPAFLFQRQGKFSELLLGTRLRYMLHDASKFTRFKSVSAASIGVYFRNKDALIATLQYELVNCSIGFSYDINISSLNPYSNLRGGFEISLLYGLSDPLGLGRSRFK